MKDMRFLPADSTKRLAQERSLVNWAADRSAAVRFMTAGFMPS